MEKIRKLERLFTSEETQQIERYIIESGTSNLSLLQKAGQSAGHKIISYLPDIFTAVVYAGTGHNGADAWVTANELADQKIPTLIVDLETSSQKSQDRISIQQRIEDQKHPFIEILVVHENTLLESLDETLISWLDTQMNRFEEQTFKNNTLLIVDGLLGVGLERELNSLYQNLIHSMNEYSWFRQSQLNDVLNPHILSLDIPSGINANTGKCFDSAVQADTTITFITSKQGLYRDTGKSCSGIIFKETLGLALEDLYYSKSEPDTKPQVLTYEPARIPGRTQRGQGNSHKGTYGTLTCIGGDEGMGGAILLAGEAGACMGSGRTVIVSRKAHCEAALARAPHIITESDPNTADKKWISQATALVIGPGMGKESWAEYFMQAVFKYQIPCVFDADALNLIAENDQIRTHYFQWIEQAPYSIIMTPHPLEAKRLMPDIDNPFELAMAISQKYQCYCVLKGHGTLIAHWPSQEILVCPTGNGALAKAGQGDTLSGMIGAFLAQGWSHREAASIAVWAHGKAADLWVLKESDLSLLPQSTASLAAKQLKYHMNKRNSHS